MGFLYDDDPRDREHWKRIKGALKRRGLVPIDEWEIHGPHQDMNYVMYVGYAEAESRPGASLCVAIYPWASYEVDDPSKWWNTSSENRIRCKKK